MNRVVSISTFFSALVMILAVTSCDTSVDPALTDDLAPAQQIELRNGVSSSATVQFGDHNAGSPFPPESGHDASFHASDKMVPRTVVIAEGGEVTYHVTPFHQVAIYAPGTKPADIDISLLEDAAVPFPPFVIPDFIINDPNDRVALSPPFDVVDTEWTTPAGTFDTPGKYLVICTTAPHFIEADMYGWVIVK